MRQGARKLWHAVMATSSALLALFRVAPTTQSVRIQNTQDVKVSQV